MLQPVASDALVNSPRVALMDDDSSEDTNVELADDDDDDNEHDENPLDNPAENEIAPDNTGNWLTNGVRRLKREVSRLLGHEEAAKPRKVRKTERNGKKHGKGKKGGKKAKKAEKLLKKSLRRLPKKDGRPKRQWDVYPTDDEDDFAAGSGNGALEEQLCKFLSNEMIFFQLSLQACTYHDLKCYWKLEHYKPPAPNFSLHLASMMAMEGGRPCIHWYEYQT